MFQTVLLGLVVSETVVPLPSFPVLPNSKGSRQALFFIERYCYFGLVMKKPTAAILTVIAVLSRLLPHPSNFTTVGATSLFAGGRLGRPWNYLVPLAVMVLTDLIIGLHGTMLFVYASIVVSVLIGERYLHGQFRASKGVVAALASSTVFFIITNFGVWLTTTMYPKSFAGLLECYVMGLPFWRNMLLSDIIFTVGFFGLYTYAQRANIISAFDKKLVGYLGLRTKQGGY